MGLLERQDGGEWGLPDDYPARIEALEDEEYSTTFRSRRRSRDGQRGSTPYTLLGDSPAREKYATWDAVTRLCGIPPPSDQRPSRWPKSRTGPNRWASLIG